MDVVYAENAGAIFGGFRFYRNGAYWSGKSILPSFLRRQESIVLS